MLKGRKAGLNSAVALVGAVAMLPTMAHAQSDTGQSGTAQSTAVSDDAQTSDIIVTAQKRSERLQDVPVSITAVSPNELSMRGATNIEQIQASIPGFSSQTIQTGSQYVQLRGISTSIGKTGVGEYLDEMPIILDQNAVHIHLNLLDMQAVEVIRGPQATLYGEGSMGGAVHYVTARPDLHSISGSVEGELGHVTDGGTSYRANGVLNLPLIDGKLGIRLLAAIEREGGWIDNPVLGKKNANGVTTSTFRAKLLALPTDRLELSLLVLHQNSDQNYANRGVNRQSTSNVRQYSNDQYTAVNAVVKYLGNSFSVTNSAGFLDHKLDYAYDLTRTLLPILNAPVAEGGIGLAPGTVTSIPAPGRLPARIYTNEFRIASEGNSRFSWMTGAYFRQSTSRNDALAVSSPLNFPDLFSFFQRTKSTAYALYAEAKYKPLEKLTVTGGIRYYHDKETFDATGTAFGPLPDIVNQQANFHALNPRLNISYEFSRSSLLYASAAKGFRSGGFNSTTGPGVPPSFGPDSLWTYEVGTKHQLFDRRLSIDAAIYYTNWSNVQTAFFIEGNPNPANISGGKVSGWGTDISVSARPIDGLTLSSAYSWNNLKHKVVTGDHLPGDPTDFTLNNTYSASAEYRHALSNAVKGFARIDFSHSGDGQVAVRSIGQIVPLRNRNTLDARIGAEIGAFQISVFASNIFDNRVPVVEPLSVFFENVEQRPRTIGINLKSHF